MHQQSEQAVIDPTQVEVDRLWRKIDELITTHGEEMQLLFGKLDSAHRENQALRREKEASFAAGHSAGLLAARDRAESHDCGEDTCVCEGEA